MLSFTFNSASAAYATKSREDNRFFISIGERNVNDVLKYRGYVYLNQIYEYFGVKWDTERENLCYTYKSDDSLLKFAIARENGDGFDIDIL